ncbi:hypothetical protein [Candidatus Azobacteroides pseudotrichonymphae]|uniref:Uncharacterized protein n=1 Tax=Azobacteroides pseudotrichonymphae genomovar. CFP2 TaxID=511995 RepID=B6YRX2_AZOPC|nr:hypothetical protein [Candidatus Azobacteroides pseudotrichonymphae]BAG83944.1 hypothetical protein CFPG_681 [Candidatus Azobacteroides pseudotrichonymphae genomovar. CFP2]
MQGGGIDYNTLARLCHQAKRTNYTLDQLSELRSKLMEETFMWQIADEEWVTAVNWLKRKGIIKIEEKSNQRAVHNVVASFWDTMNKQNTDLVMDIEGRIVRRLQSK